MESRKRLAKREQTTRLSAHERTILVEMAGYYVLLGAAGVSALILH